MWDGIIAKYGKIDCIVSNPPFGKVTKAEQDKSWLKYKGADIDMAAIEIALKYAEYVDMILPKASCTFQYSNRLYYEEKENEKVDKLRKETGLNFIMSCTGIDTSVYEKFKNTPMGVECVEILKEGYF